MSEIQTLFKTPDGKEFTTLEAAKMHIDANAKLKAEIKEDISKILLKLQNYKTAKVSGDHDGYYSIENETELQDKFLCSLKSVLDDISKHEHTVEQYLTQYYNSNCY
jgi:hypothetical protein